MCTNDMFTVAIMLNVIKERGQQEMLTDKQSKYLTTFGIKLREELEQMGLTLSGLYPLLKVSLYTIEVDLVDRDRVTLWYGPQQEKLGECDVLAYKVVELLKKWQDKLEQPINDTLFLQTLYDVYSSFAAKTGDQVAIDDILSEYVSRKIYRTKKEARAHFSHDMFKLKERDIDDLMMSLVTATRAYTHTRKGHIWVPLWKRQDGTYHTTYISHVIFQKTPRSVSDFRKEIEKKIEEGV